MSLMCIDQGACTRFTKALREYSERSAGDGVGDAAIDLLRDMFHWCNWNGELMKNLLQEAAAQFKVDLDDKCNPVQGPDTKIYVESTHVLTGMMV